MADSCVVVVQSQPNHGSRLVFVTSKMHEVTRGIDMHHPATETPHMSPLAAYNQSKLAQVSLPVEKTDESSQCQATSMH